MKNSLLDAFNIPKNKPYRVSLTSYDIFPDKKLLEALRTKIIENLIDNENNMTLETINKEIDETLQGYDLTNLERSHIFNLIDDEINGYGPLTSLLEDNNISEIMVNSPKEIYIEVEGKIIKDESVSFINDEHILRIIKKLIEPLDRTIDFQNPIIDSRLKDGSRINAIIPPLSVKGPVLAIRKFMKNMATMDDLIGKGCLTPWMARFLQTAVKAKLNILVCGGTSSGKTTILNILSNFIDVNERIMTIEETAELKLSQNHVISLETRDMNYDISDLIINSLHMRPDRIIVGEVQGKEAFDILQAMNTNHEGSMTTLHANSPQEALKRLETMILLTGIDIPIKVIREYIESTIDLIINIERLSDGKRKITKICEVNGFKNEQINLDDIFIFEQKGIRKNKEIDGEYTFIEGDREIYKKIKNKGFNLNDIFESNKEIINEENYDLEDI